MTFYCCLKVEGFEEDYKPSKNKLFLWHPVCFKVYVTWLYLIFMYILPFSLLAVFNILIYRSELLVWSFNWIFAGKSDEPRRYEPPSPEAKKGKLVGTFFFFLSGDKIFGNTGLAMMLPCVLLFFFRCKRNKKLRNYKNKKGWNKKQTKIILQHRSGNDVALRRACFLPLQHSCPCCECTWGNSWY